MKKHAIYMLDRVSSSPEYTQPKLVKPIIFQHFRFNRWMEGRGGWQKLNSIGVYVYIWASVYIGLCLCVHICILIAGFFMICICEIGLSFFQLPNSS